MPIENIIGVVIVVIIALIALYYRIKFKREREDFVFYINETENLVQFLYDVLEDNGIKIEFNEYNEEEENE